MTDWTIRVSELADRASDALARDDLEAALAGVAEAFTIADAEGTQQHPAFASLLCVAGDVAISSDETDSARSLYSRAHQIAVATKADGSIAAKALVALGSLSEADGDRPRAAEYYREAADVLAASAHADAEVAHAAILDAIERLR